MRMSCPLCGKKHRSYPELCISQVENRYGHTIIMHINHPYKEGLIDPEEIMLSKIKLAADSYAKMIKSHGNDHAANMTHHIKVNTENTKAFFMTQKYKESFK